MRASTLVASYVLAMLLPQTAHAWNPLRTENDEVKRGNELMQREQYDEALEAYDQAAEELPESKGVQLNRGLALLAKGMLEPAKEAFLSAADPSAGSNTRADAYYDLGVAFAREGDALAQQGDFEGATARYREAVDAFKRALRQRPGDRDAAWNLEYALQRIREQEEKQQQEQQEQEQQEQEQQEQEQQEQEQQEQEQQEQEQQEQEQQEQEQQEQEQQQQEQQEQEQQQQEQQQQEQQEPRAGDPRESPPQMEPREVQRFLDALEQNEESLPVERARRRAAGRRAPEKDW